MRMRGAAARLGLGIARDLKTHPFPHIKKGGSSSSPLLFIRKSSCSATATTTATATEENKKGGTGSDKSLYLYFTELIGRSCAHDSYFSGLRYPIRSIKLSYLLSSSSIKTDGDLKVTEAVHTLKRTDRFRNWGCGPYGSQILFNIGGVGDNKFTRSYGRSASQDRSNEICSFEIEGEGQGQHRNPKLKNSPVIKRMKQGKEKEFLFVEELPDGKVYCLCPLPRVKDSEIFQVLDTTRKGSKKKWLPLQAPPADKYPKMGVIHPYATAVVAGTKVLLWYPDKDGAYYFDVTQPENGWSPTSPSIASCIPFLNCWHPLAVEHDGNFLMFTFDPKPHDTVQVYLMSHKCDTLQALNQPLVLPELPWNNNDRYSSSLQYQFVHLGPQKVCLVLHKFFYPSEDIPDYLSLAESEKLAFPGRNKGNVFLITFEYEISNSESLDIHYRLLTTRHFEYISKRANRRFATCTKMAKLSGATVL